MSDNIYTLIETAENNGIYQVSCYPFIDYQAAYEAMCGMYHLSLESLKKDGNVCADDCFLTPDHACIDMNVAWQWWDINSSPLLDENSGKDLLKYRKLSLLHDRRDIRQVARIGSISCPDADADISVFYEKGKMELYFLSNCGQSSPYRFTVERWCVEHGVKTFDAMEAARNYVTNVDVSAVFGDMHVDRRLWKLL